MKSKPKTYTVIGCGSAARTELKPSLKAAVARTRACWRQSKGTHTVAVWVHRPNYAYGTEGHIAYRCSRTAVIGGGCTSTRNREPSTYRLWERQQRARGALAGTSDQRQDLDVQIRAALRELTIAERWEKYGPRDGTMLKARIRAQRRLAQLVAKKGALAGARCPADIGSQRAPKRLRAVRP